MYGEEREQQSQERSHNGDKSHNQQDPATWSTHGPDEATERGHPPNADMDGQGHNETEESRFLIGLEYGDRAERRRVEYRLENWDGTVTQTPRMARIVEGEDFYELFDELQDTVDDPEHLSVYELDDLTPSDQERTVKIDRIYDVDPEKLEWAVDSLLNKRTVTQGEDTAYQLRPDAGTAEVTFTYDLMSVQHGARMALTITGPPPAPNAVKDAMLRDLGYLLPAPEEVFD